MKHSFTRLLLRADDAYTLCTAVHPGTARRPLCLGAGVCCNVPIASPAAVRLLAGLLFKLDKATELCACPMLQISNANQV